MRVTKIGWAGSRTERYSDMVGFVVEDLPAAVAELEQAGVELLGGGDDEKAGSWRHFRAPDGNVYELSTG
jgi:hypothetical protein